MHQRSRVTRSGGASRFLIGIASAMLMAMTSAAGAQPVLTTLTAPAALNSNAAPDIGSNDDRFVDIATDRKGHWIAVWDAPANDTTVDCSGSSDGKCGPDFDIMLATSSDFGETWSTIHFLNTDAESDSFADEQPLIATDRKGNWVVVWSRNDEVAVSRSVNNGQTWTPPQVLSSVDLPFNFVREKVDFETDRQGVWILVWSSNAQGSGGDFDIFATRSLDAGMTWGPQIAVNPAFSDDPVYDDQEPAIATDGYGNWVVTWESDSQANGWQADWDILAARSSNDGVSWSAPVAVNNDAATDPFPNSDDRRPAIATDSRGNWVVVWEEFGDSSSPTGTEPDILWARSTNLGAGWGVAAPIDPNATTDGRNTELIPTITTDGNGIWNVAWMAGLSTETDLLISTSDSNGTNWSGLQVLNTQALSDNGDDSDPRLAVDDNGNWVAVWSSTDDLEGTVFGDSDIFVATFGVATLFPLNDLAINPLPLFPGGQTGNMTEADTDGLASCGNGGDQDVWYRFQLDGLGALSIDTCGTFDAFGVDTVLSVHTEPPGFPDNEIFCNDDWTSGGARECRGSGLDSSLEVAVGSEPVWVRVAHFPGTPAGEFVLNVGYVPEPSGSLLLTGGLLGLVLLASRCRRDSIQAGSRLNG